MSRILIASAVWRPLAALVIAGSVCAGSLIAEEPLQESAKSSADASPLRKQLDESVNYAELFDSEQSEKPMAVRIVMRWANNIRQSDDGMTVLFLSHGRPAAACCIYPWHNQSLALEFDSLSRGTFVAKQSGTPFWQPATPGIEFHAITDADPPADSPAARLRQMKALSREFSSKMLGMKAQNEDREELRLLPRPLYRYENLPEGDCIDGAVFAFVQGTDPESLLLLEAIKTKDRTEWQYAFGRRTTGELEGRHRGKAVWHVERGPATRDPRSIHYVLSRPLNPDVLEQLDAAATGR
ncbi:MAG TPA: hypothetical protein VHB77_13715 [Planctomycetaceae bacterium]|nr:hypothetical protein [Planctomycetaceae bacterium]